MQDEVRVSVAARDAEVARLRTAGDPAKGEFHCAHCSYGVIVHTKLPTCPMCGGGMWQQTSWHPLTRVRVLQ
jgi:Zn finger protein HypA/HybF involved in hydrogenase expression